MSSMKRVTILAVLAIAAVPVAYRAFASDIISLPGAEVRSPARTWVLSNVQLNTSSNVVSGTLLMTESASLSDIVQGALSVGTYDPSVAPLGVTKHGTSTTATFNATAMTLQWDFSFEIPAGERFAGVYVDGGSYRRAGSPPKTVPLVVAMDFAYQLD